jgi:NAD(P) transhydrogenase subunit alpha
MMHLWWLDSAVANAGEAVGAQEASHSPFVLLLTVFVLAMLVGTDVIKQVPPLLHTPLMSGSNAVSGITIVGAILSSGSIPWLSTALGFVAVVFATINVVGGFLVTNRMLSMFQKKA